MDTVMTLMAPLNAGIFVTGLVTVSFSKGLCSMELVSWLVSLLISWLVVWLIG
jgi:hypothetical protein